MEPLSQTFICNLYLETLCTVTWELSKVKPLCGTFGNLPAATNHLEALLASRQVFAICLGTKFTTRPTNHPTCKPSQITLHICSAQDQNKHVLFGTLAQPALIAFSALQVFVFYCSLVVVLHEGILSSPLYRWTRTGRSKLSIVTVFLKLHVSGQVVQAGAQQVESPLSFRFSHKCQTLLVREVPVPLWAEAWEIVLLANWNPDKLPKRLELKGSGWIRTTRMKGYFQTKVVKN